MIGLDVTARAMARATANMRSEILGPGGAGTIGYKPAGSTAVLRAVGDKLDENRSVLDFLDKSKHASIKDGTSTWDASAQLNAGIADVGGKHIDMGAGQLAIGSPIVMVRGTSLIGRGTFDDAPGRAAKLLLLPGANCAMIQTSTAAGGPSGSNDTYFRLEGVTLDGNAENQTATTDGGIVQFYGAYMGSLIRYCFIRNTKGPGIVLGSGPLSPAVAHGCDVQIDHLWVTKCILEDYQYAFDTNQGLYDYTSATNNPYGLNSGANHSAAIQGLCTFSHLFVENMKSAFDYDPRNVQSERTRNGIRLHAMNSVKLTRPHVEGALYGITASRCRTVSVDAPSFAWCGRSDGWTGGSGGVNDSAAFSLLDQQEQFSIKDAQGYSGVPGGIAALALVRPRAPFSNDRFPAKTDALTSSGATSLGGYRASKSATPPDDLGMPHITNEATIVRRGSNLRPGLRVGYVADDLANLGGFYAYQGKLHLGSNKNRSGSYKEFITVNCENTTQDGVAFSDPITIAGRTSTAGFGAGAVGWVGATAAVQYLFTKTPNGVEARIPIITEGAGSPVGSVMPISSRGRHFYYDTANDNIWCSTGTTTSNWKQMTA